MAVRRNIGFLTDQFGLYERLTTREYLTYFGELNGMDRAADRRPHRRGIAAARRWTTSSTRRTKGFSQGQRIKVALARTLLHRPRHLLLDEPSRGLDVMSTRALRTALAALRADGCCVIMATHVMQEVTQSVRRRDRHRRRPHRGPGLARGTVPRTGIANLEDAFVSLVGTEEGIA
jgi:sodium transport system ATP-binding protein